MQNRFISKFFLRFKVSMNYLYLFLSRLYRIHSPATAVIVSTSTSTPVSANCREYCEVFLPTKSSLQINEME